MNALLNRLTELTESPNSTTSLTYKEVYEHWNCQIPEELAEIDGSYAGGYFVERALLIWNFLSPSDLLSMSIQADLAAPEERPLVPIIDCTEGDFICFDVQSKSFLLWNAIDQMVYESNKSLEAFLPK